MVLEKVNHDNVNELSRYHCKEYLMYLRSSLGKAQKKSEVNEMRRAIHKIEDRLKKLNEYV